MRLYDLQGDNQQFLLGSEVAELGIIDTRIHENGLIALTGSFDSYRWKTGKMRGYWRLQPLVCHHHLLLSFAAAGRHLCWLKATQEAMSSFPYSKRAGSTHGINGVNFLTSPQSSRSIFWKRNSRFIYRQLCIHQNWPRLIILLLRKPSLYYDSGQCFHVSRINATQTFMDVY